MPRDSQTTILKLTVAAVSLKLLGLVELGFYEAATTDHLTTLFQPR